MREKGRHVTYVAIKVMSPSAVQRLTNDLSFSLFGCESAASIYLKTSHAIQPSRGSILILIEVIAKAVLLRDKYRIVPHRSKFSDSPVAIDEVTNNPRATRLNHIFPLLSLVLLLRPERPFSISIAFLKTSKLTARTACVDFSIA